MVSADKSALITLTRNGAAVQSLGVVLKAPTAGLQSFGYWLGWETDVPLSAVPWRALTHLSLFALQTTAGTALDTSLLSGVANVPAWVNAVHAQGKLALITIGGISDQHWDTATNSANLNGFVSNLVSYMVSNGFDGVDIDIEQNNWGSIGPPSPPWTAAVKAISQAAHAVKTKAGRTPLVTAPIDQTWMDADLAPFASYLDLIPLMGYTASASGSLMSSQLADVISTGKASSAQKVLMGFDVEPGDTGQTVTAAQAQSIAKWASANCGGIMVWPVQGDYHAGAWPSLTAIAPYVGSSPVPVPPGPIVTPS